MPSIQREYLGSEGLVDHYYNLTTQQLEWRVPEIRESVAAPPGYKILAGDFSQVEVAIAASRSNDPWLKAAIQSRKDIYCYCGADLYGRELGFDYDLINTARKNEKHPRHDEMVDIRNNRTKAVVLGVIYGMTAFGLSKRIEKPEEVCQSYIDAFFGKARGLKRLVNDLGRQALSLGYTSSEMGRRRNYELPRLDDPEAERKIRQILRFAANHPMQATSADMTKIAMALIYLAMRGGKLTGDPIYDARLLLQAHDEIVMMSLEEQAFEVATIMKQCMEKAFRMIIPDLPVEVEILIGDYWKKG